jgi:hypothetical protein
VAYTLLYKRADQKNRRIENREYVGRVDKVKSRSWDAGNCCSGRKIDDAHSQVVVQLMPPQLRTGPPTQLIFLPRVPAPPIADAQIGFDMLNVL